MITYLSTIYLSIYLSISIQYTYIYIYIYICTIFIYKYIYNNIYIYMQYIYTDVQNIYREYIYIYIYLCVCVCVRVCVCACVYYHACPDFFEIWDMNTLRVSSAHTLPLYKCFKDWSQPPVFRNAVEKREQCSLRSNLCTSINWPSNFVNSAYCKCSLVSHKIGETW